MVGKEYRFTSKWPYHISCGGIVYRMRGGEPELVALVRHDGKYDLPKGTLHVHETLEQCALREVVEESGQKGKVVGYLGGRLDDSVDARTDMRISKITHYFAIKWLADTGVHDDEYLRSEWLPIKRAQELLKPSSANIVARFKEFVSTFPNNI